MESLGKLRPSFELTIFRKNSPSILFFIFFLSLYFLQNIINSNEKNKKNKEKAGLQVDDFQKIERKPSTTINIGGCNG